MKQSLQLRLGQQITMTPQLQQAIRLLQLSTLELQVEIQQALESNIMLEVPEDEYETENEIDNQELDFSSQIDEKINQTEGELKTSTLDSESQPESSDDSAFDSLAENIPTELAVDSDWEDIYEGILPPTDLPNANEFNGKDLLVNQECAQETLKDHLYWQLELTPFNDLDRAIATAIIDGIDNDGYLQASLDEIVQSLGKKSRVYKKDIETVLHRIQHFEPLGVGARDLSECLLLQLKTLPAKTPWLKEAKKLVTQHLELLGAHDYAQLVKRMKLSREELREVVDIIQSLNPRPGAALETTQTAYVVPDVFVKKVKMQWVVNLNSEISPKLRVNAYYASLISKNDNSSDNNHLKSHLQEARWFIKSLKSRHETLLKVAKCIVKRQSGFLDYGEEAMKPLVLHDIASELEMHESTISRVTTQKYLHTPRGIFELKYFFSSHVSTKTGGECSSTAIRAMIKKLIAVESSAKPLSDSKIAKLLSERGIKVARRTVAKYREAMVIPPSNERKRLT
ncbi:DNA-directed RNA polymerase specialized sigma subunit, sigma54 [Beggiatoa sp. PS]|nr:DNA-directed RNA polymerase specialized sigma subunit, sigma54 [Beggiatoa sp. PS]